MSNQSQNNKRIAKNTAILYVRMLFTVGISFYSTRLVMKNLGVSDYGIYGVVGSITSMMYIVTTSINTSISRYLTFNLGTGNINNLRKVYSTSVIILLIFAILVLIIGESIGLWYLNTHLNIPSERLFAANCVYQFILLEFLLEFMSTPYNAAIISHERMGAFAFVTIQDVVVKFLIALAIAYSPFDTLIYYAALMCLNKVVLRVVYYVYCKRNFEECTYTLVLEKKIFKELLSYSSLTLIPTIVCMIASSGTSLLVNAFYGTIANAAQSAANQINNMTGAFSNNFLVAIKPQITKNYAAGNKTRSLYLVYTGTKISFLLLYIPILPVIFEIDFILDLWLKEVPPYTNMFVISGLILALVNSLQNTTGTLISATGDIRLKAVVASVAYALPFPICLLLFKFGLPPYMSTLAMVISAAITFYPNITVANKLTGIHFGDYFKNALFPLLSVVLPSCAFMAAFTHISESSFSRALLSAIISTTIIVFMGYYVVLNKSERNKMRNFIKEKIKKR